MSATKNVTVVGAGIVGACVALALAKRGCSVSILERDRPAARCSFGNAGALSPGSCVPMSVPGQWKKIPQWLLDPSGPLRVSPKTLVAELPWFMRFLSAGRKTKVQSIAPSLLDLLQNTFENYRYLSDSERAGGLIRKNGALHVYRCVEELRNDPFGWQLRASNGVKAIEVDADFINSRIPAFEGQFEAGMFLPDHGYCANPEALVQVLIDEAVQLGARFTVDEVHDIVVDGGQVRRVIGKSKEYPTETLVIEAGTGSMQLAAKVGVRVPLARERGYHVTFHDPGVSFDMPVTSTSGKFVLTPMEMGVRFAGTSEFTSKYAKPNNRRIQVLMQQARKIFPSLNMSNYTTWMGERPSLPDSLPVISAAPNVSNAFLTFGHGHLGMSGASTTSLLISDLVVGQTPPIDLTPFSAKRFRRPWP